MSVAFIACVEAGRLEAQAEVLFGSIRRFAGRHASARIVAFRPRLGPPLAPRTIALFRDLEVDLVEERLNVEFEHYALANKVYASAWAEERLDEDVVVFVDSDTFFCQSPEAFELRDGTDVLVRPVNRKNRGTSGEGDPKDRFWLAMYRLCGVDPPPLVETTVDHARVRAYWNTGLMAVRRAAGVFAEWRRDFETVLRAGHVPKSGLKDMDQVTFSATLARHRDAVTILDGRYNYPLPMRGRLEEPLRSAPLEELVHVHYFRWFHKPGFLASLEPPLPRDSTIAAWLSRFLPFEPLDDDPGRGKNRGIV